MAHVINSVGNALSPFDSFLLLRGTKTLAVRMDRQQSSAMAVAEMIQSLGFTVHYPGLKSHPKREVHERIANGPGAVLSFVTGDKAMSERIVGATRLWGISVSFGCVNSLISMPCAMSYVLIIFSAVNPTDHALDMHPSTLLPAPHAAFQRISSVSALVSRTQPTFSTICVMLYWKRALSRLSKESMVTITFVHP